MQKRKYFVCGSFKHIVCHCRNKRNIEKNRRVEIGRLECQPSSNKFKVLTSRVIKTEVPNKGKEKKEKLLREVMVKIELKQKNEEDGITVEVLLDSEVTGLVMSLDFVKKNRFKKRKLERPIYMRNVDRTFNYEGLMVEVELFYKEYKKRMETM